MLHVPFIDATALHALKRFYTQCNEKNILCFITETTVEVGSVITKAIPAAKLMPTTEAVLENVQEREQKAIQTAHEVRAFNTLRFHSFYFVYWAFIKQSYFFPTGHL